MASCMPGRVIIFRASRLDFSICSSLYPAVATDAELPASTLALRGLRVEREVTARAVAPLVRDGSQQDVAELQAVEEVGLPSEGLAAAEVVAGERAG